MITTLNKHTASDLTQFTYPKFLNNLSVFAVKMQRITAALLFFFSED